MKKKSIDTSKDFQLNDAVFKVAMNSQAVYQSVVAEMTRNVEMIRFHSALCMVDDLWLHRAIPPVFFQRKMTRNFKKSIDGRML